MNRKGWLFATVVSGGVALDVATKRWALASLEPGVTQHALGGALKLTLGFNRGIAFGLNLGSASRFVFAAVGLAVLAATIVLYVATPAARRARCTAIALMCGGATGNLVDRVLHARGVVDFLGPYDLGFMNWPIFNLADCYVVIGTVGLAIALWSERRKSA